MDLIELILLFLFSFEIKTGTSRECVKLGLHYDLCVAKEDIENISHLSGPFKDYYKCYEKAVCMFKGGTCKWIQTEEFYQCMENIKRSNYNFEENNF